MKLKSVIPTAPKSKTFSVRQFEEGVLYVAESSVQFGGFYAIRYKETVIYFDCREHLHNDSPVWAQELTDNAVYIKAIPGTQITLSA